MFDVYCFFASFNVIFSFVIDYPCMYKCLRMYPYATRFTCFPWNVYDYYTPLANNARPRGRKSTLLVRCIEKITNQDPR